MKNRAMVFIFIFSLLLMFSCSTEDTARVTIKTGLSIQKQTTQMSIPDRIMSIFSTELFAAEPPSNISSLTLSITGPGMEDINYTSQPVSEIKLDVPAGADRKFTLSASTPSATLRGEATVDLQSGEIKTISIDMLIYETRIILPDRNNNRIIQIDDIDGTGWKELNHTPFSAIGLPNASQFVPYDTCFDNRGRIYIANNGFSTGEDIIIRINDFDNPGAEVFATGSGSGPVSVAVNKKTDYVYFATTTALYRKHTDSAASAEPISFTATSPNIKGITLDNDGFVYMALYTSSGNQILKINTELASGNTTVLVGSGLSTAWDVLFRDSYLYVANQSAVAATENKVLRYTLSGESSGFLHQPPDSSDSLAGPRRFVAILNRRFWLIDHAESGPPKRLLSFNDFSGEDWQSYNGESPFLFYSAC